MKSAKDTTRNAPGTSVLGARSAGVWEMDARTTELLRPADPGEIDHLETIDLVYRTLCGVLYNFVPTSGHPGGSISSGRIVLACVLSSMDYDFSRPGAKAADRLIYAAGHKAMGLYAMFALRNELIRIAAPELLPEEKDQLRLEDLLGFRRNPTQETPLFRKFRVKALDGHPSPPTPFVPITTGASGVGVPAAFGFALGALDTFGEDAPRIHVLEGEGGMTAGRVHEAMAAASSANIHNIILHLDWNQASIDSDRVCAEGGVAGDYVQWNPMELARLHNWNLIVVEDGTDFQKILEAQALARERRDQPTAIIYRTTKGWRYGIEGKSSHGAGHPYASEGFHRYVAEPFQERFSSFDIRFPKDSGSSAPEAVEEAFHETLLCVRRALEAEAGAARYAAKRIREAKKKLEGKVRKPRSRAPKLDEIYGNDLSPDRVPQDLAVAPGASFTLRDTLGNILNFLNHKTGGALIGSAADLFGSTSLSRLAKGFPPGFYNAKDNPDARLIPVGGICEDAMGGFMTGLSAFGEHMGVTSSYGAFIAALEHIPARLHGIGQQARFLATGEPMRVFIMINGHVGIKTGEDGPTHADPQCLQLLQENFPRGVCLTLTPWEPAEIWPLFLAALQRRPAVICPFVTRPAEVVPDRRALGLPPPEAAVKGLYRLVRGNPGEAPYHGTLVLQGSEVAMTFVGEVLPALRDKGININVYYVAGAELFDLLSREEQEEIFPEARAREAMGITGFTISTMYRWVTSRAGLERSLHPFRAGHYLGSGKAHKVIEEAGLDGKAMLAAILEYAESMVAVPA